MSGKRGVTKATGGASVGINWEAYALSLEEKLRNSVASGAGWKALSDAVINELTRVAPENALVNEQNRREIFVNAWNASRLSA